MEYLGRDVEERAGRHWEVRLVRRNKPGSLYLYANHQAHCQEVGCVRRLEIPEGKVLSSDLDIMVTVIRFNIILCKVWILIDW